jgi:hypothetical protein
MHIIDFFTCEITLLIPRSLHAPSSGTKNCPGLSTALPIDQASE